MGVDYRKWHPKNEENDRSIKEQGEQQEDWIGDETNLFGFDRVSAIASLLSDRFSLKWPTWAKWNTLASLAVMPTTTTKEDATIKKTKKKKNRSQKHQIAFNSWTKRPGFSRNNSLHTTLTLLYPLFTRNLSITRWPMPPKRSTFFFFFFFFEQFLREFGSRSQSFCRAVTESKTIKGEPFMLTICNSLLSNYFRGRKTGEVCTK